MKKSKLLFIALILPLLYGCNTQNSSNSENIVTSTSVEENNNGLNVIYVSPKGEATNSGSKESPLDAFSAMNRLNKGGRIILLEGTYSLTSTLRVTRDSEKNSGVGVASKEEERKYMTPEKKEDGTYVDVLFDFSQMAYASSNRGISLDSDYWTVEGFKVKGAGDNGIYIGGNYNIVSQMETFECRDTGLQLGRSFSNYETIDTWPSNNLIINCTSYDNHDPTGEDSDGFACKLTTGYNNVFDGCIAYNNVDDGWDLYTKGESGPIGPVTLKNCVAFNNGITTGGIGTANSDGNGFKLGGESIAVNHTVINCVAFNNLATGFTDNSNPGTIYFENCTAFNNGSRDEDGYNFSTCRDRATSLNSYKNCLSFSIGEKVNPITKEKNINNSKDAYKGSASYCAFFNSLSSLYIGSMQEVDYDVEALRGTLFEDLENPFVSITTPQEQSFKGEAVENKVDIHKVLRNKDGSVNLGDFLKLKDESKFKTMGENSSPLGANLHN